MHPLSSPTGHVTHHVQGGEKIPRKGCLSQKCAKHGAVSHFPRSCLQLCLTHIQLG
jgi:hypothetical protein